MKITTTAGRALATLLLLLLVSALAGQALAAEPEGDGKKAATTFETAETDEPGEAATPLELLAACDQKLEACKRDEIGVPYLAAAYIAIWLILVGFLWLNRREQQRLQLEVEELRARLRELEGGAA